MYNLESWLLPCATLFDRRQADSPLKMKVVNCKGPTVPTYLLESVVIYSKTWVFSRCLEDAAAANSSFWIYPSYGQVLPTPCFVHRVDAKPPVFKNGFPVHPFLYTVE
jgi:hypothetical protein